MRKLLNTLHVMTQGAYLHRDGETVAIKIGDELKLRVPVHTLEGLVCWGRVSLVTNYRPCAPVFSRYLLVTC